MDQPCQDAFSVYPRCISGGVIEYLQKPGRGESKMQHLHNSGGDMADDPAAAAAGRDFGNRCGGAAGGSGGFAAEPVSARAAEADLAPHRRLQSRTAEMAEAAMQTSGRRTGPSVARDAESGRWADELCAGRFVTGTGGQPLAAQSLPTGGKPARTCSLAGLRIVVLHELETGDWRRSRAGDRGTEQRK